MSALTTGEVDGVFGTALSGKSVQALAGADNVEVFRAPSYQVHYLAVNTQMKPFDDPRVRQALSYAIDKAGMLQSVWAGEGEAGIKSPVDAGHVDVFGGHLPGGLRRAAVVRSRSRKGEGPDRGGRGNRREGEDARRAPVRRGAGAHHPGRRQADRARPQPGEDPVSPTRSRGSSRGRRLGTTRSRSRSGDADIPDPAGNLLIPFLSSNVVTNNSAYHNPKVDELLQAQRETTDPDERARLLAEAQALVVEDQPWIVFYSPDAVMVLNKRLGGYQIRPLTYWDPFAGDFSGT